MGSFSDAIDAAIAGDDWCAVGAAKRMRRPSDPQGLYDSCVHGSSFLQYLNITNPTKCRELFLSLLDGLADRSSSRSVGARLRSQARGVADYAADAAREAMSSECDSLSQLSARFLGGGSTVDAFAAFRCLARAYAETNGIGIVDAELELAARLKSMCTIDEWANGLS